jgi:mevalonate kinase
MSSSETRASDARWGEVRRALLGEGGRERPPLTAGILAGQACGKVILLGEHAVVYGVPALAGALAGGVTVEESPGTGLVRIPAWALELDLGSAACEAITVGRALRAIAARLGGELRKDVDLTVHFGLPTGSGLGSSAALAVAFARALCKTGGLRADGDAIEAAAMDSETVIHGKPSGLDHTVAQRGGFGLFVRGQGLSPIRAARPIPLVIGHTGKERDTKGRVARVAELVAERPQEVGSCLSRIGELAATAARAVEVGDLAALGAAMKQNQIELRTLEVSCPEIEHMVGLADEAGALACKLTGGGGGGCVIALAPGKEREVAAAWATAGLRSFVTEVGGAS